MVDIQAEIKAIELMIFEHQEANLCKDLDRMMNLFTEDIIYHVPYYPPVKGKETLRALLDDVKDRMDKLIITSEKTEVSSSGDIAFNTGLAKIKYIREDFDEYKYFLGLRKTFDGWKIAVDTFSTNG